MSQSTTESLLSARFLGEKYRATRALTEELCEPLETEDYVVQSMPDVSPTKWHLAHVSWYFETFVLKPHARDHRAVRPEFEVLFNSYYNLVGEQFPRSRRGVLTRPTVAMVYDYRRRIDERMAVLLDEIDESRQDVLGLVELGIHHEQQHQELLLMDIKHVFSCNPMNPVYRPEDAVSGGRVRTDPRWLRFDGGIRTIGHTGEEFCFDNERPVHEVLIRDFRMASRPVTNGEYLEFVDGGGYGRPELWLADGWSTVRSGNWKAPLYWRLRDGAWHEFTLSGETPLDPEAPVCHVSYYEADAFATWAGARLPTEHEWEAAAPRSPGEGTFLESGHLHPQASGDGPSQGGEGPSQMLGDVWEWTRSAYSAYPGYRPPAGAVGEYNGKFMCNQQVLRGGCAVTPRSHIRHTYRNFYYPHCRWQFGGIRLAAG